MDHQSSPDCAAGSEPTRHPPWRQTGSALWQGLPTDACGLIVECTLASLLDHIDEKSFRQALLINRAFAAALLPRLGLFHRRDRPGFAPVFARHTLMYAAECARGVRRWDAHNCGMIHAQVYQASFRVPQTDDLFNALIPALDALMIDGTLRVLDEAQRETFAHYMGRMYRHLERFYLPRKKIPSVKQHLLLGLASHRSEA